jgi:hypothetical protein
VDRNRRHSIKSRNQPNQTISALSLDTGMGHPAQRWLVRRCARCIATGAEIELCN